MKSRTRTRFHIYLAPTPQLYPNSQQGEGDLRVTEGGPGEFGARVTEDGETRISEPTEE